MLSARPSFQQVRGADRGEGPGWPPRWDHGPDAFGPWSLAPGPVLPWDQSGERDQDERTRGYGAERSARTPRNSDPREAGWSPRHSSPKVIPTRTRAGGTGSRQAPVS